MELNYCRFGNGKKIMVILPGLSLKPLSGNLEPIESAYELFKDDYTVYLFDYRDKQIENMSIEDMADDVRNTKPTSSTYREDELSEFNMVTVMKGRQNRSVKVYLH